MCVYDHLEQRVWLAVDPMGIKPLYVRSRRGVSFSSEAMPIARFFGDTEPGTLASPLFESWGCYPSAGRALGNRADGARRGSCVHDFSGRSLWGIPLKSWRRANPPRGDVVDAFVESVDLHLMADVPVGLMLKVDSAAHRTAAAERSRKLDCFTPRPPGHRVGEMGLLRSLILWPPHRVLRGPGPGYPGGRRRLPVHG